MVDLEQLKQNKDALVSALVSLTKSSREATDAVIDFFSSLEAVEADTATPTDASISKPADVDDAVVDSKPGNDTKRAADAPVPKERKKRDPNAPKRPASAFLMWASEARKKYQEQRTSEGKPAMGRDEISEMLSKGWREMQKEERQHIEDEYTPKMEAWREAMKEYKEKKAKEVEDGSDTGNEPTVAESAGPTEPTAQGSEDADASVADASTPKKDKKRRRKGEETKKRRKKDE